MITWTNDCSYYSVKYDFVPKKMNVARLRLLIQMITRRKNEYWTTMITDRTITWRLRLLREMITEWDIIAHIDKKKSDTPSIHLSKTYFEIWKFHLCKTHLCFCIAKHKIVALACVRAINSPHMLLRRLMIGETLFVFLGLWVECKWALDKWMEGVVSEHI
jgi:hypothetical protein